MVFIVGVAADGVAKVFFVIASVLLAIFAQGIRCHVSSALCIRMRGNDKKVRAWSAKGSNSPLDIR